MKVVNAIPIPNLDMSLNLGFCPPGLSTFPRAKRIPNMKSMSRNRLYHSANAQFTSIGLSGMY